MSSARTSSEASVHASLGSYAADALEATDALDVEHHLIECEICRDDFDEFTETTAELTRLVATTPPVEVRTSVLRSITQIRPLPPVADEIDEVARPVAQKSSAQVSPLRTRRTGRLLLGLAAAAVVAALGAGGYAVNTHQQVTAASNVQLEANRERQVAQQETAILQAPDASVYASRLQDGNSVAYLVAKSDNAAMMISGKLAAPGPGKTYQLWTLVRARDGGLDYIPDHTFGGGLDQRVMVTGDVSRALGVAITVEPAGGSLKPTGEPDARATF